MMTELIEFDWVLAVEIGNIEIDHFITSSTVKHSSMATTASANMIVFALILATPRA